MKFSANLSFLYQELGFLDRFAAGTGEINWSFVLPELERLGYDGYIGCEYRPKTTATAGLGWLTPFLPA